MKNGVEVELLVIETVFYLSAMVTVFTAIFTALFVAIVLLIGNLIMRVKR